MKPRAETIVLDQPLLGVRLVRRHPGGIDDDEMRRREQEAFQRGRVEGERSLGEQLVRQRGELITLQNGILQSLRQALPALIAEGEKALIQLALDSARRIVADLPISAELVDAVVREALGEVEETGDVVVQLNPEDLALLEAVNAPVLLGEVAGERIRFVPTPGITRGGCLVRTRFGSVDGTRETRWNLVTQSVTGAG